MASDCGPFFHRVFFQDGENNGVCGGKKEKPCHPEVRCGRFGEDHRENKRRRDWDHLHGQM